MGFSEEVELWVPVWWSRLIRIAQAGVLLFIKPNTEILAAFGPVA
jgi:hypothetical protein